MLELIYVILSAITGLDRNVDAGLAASAQARSATVVCASPDFFTHSGKPSGVAEILTCFPNSGDTAQRAADAWRNSAPHWDVLTNTAYTRIGCGATVTGDSILYACHLARPTVVEQLANTALPQLSYWGWAFLIFAAIVGHWEWRRVRAVRALAEGRGIEPRRG